MNSDLASHSRILAESTKKAGPKVYAIGMITITDRGAYERYSKAFLPVLQRYGGTLLAADEHPSVEEGEWQHGKLILLAFDDEAAFRIWFESPEYRHIAADRHAGAHGTIILARGVQS